MKDPVRNFWQLRLEGLASVLKKNNFEAHVVDNGEQAKALALDTLIPAIGPHSVSWGGSMTFVSTGLYHELRSAEGLEIIDTFDKKIPPDELIERRRKALLVDLFFTSSNAITETGMLVNLDMIGNRVAALTFGPKHVVVFIGRNKIVPDLESAMQRIKNYVAPTNVMRLDKKTPCAKTAWCDDCKSPDRICNHWSITEKCFPKKRIEVVLINEELGL
jgi:hypothetical protein